MPHKTAQIYRIKNTLRLMRNGFIDVKSIFYCLAFYLKQSVIILVFHRI
jgi:hypothetical protein